MLVKNRTLDPEMANRSGLGHDNSLKERNSTMKQTQSILKMSNSGALL